MVNLMPQGRKLHKKRYSRQSSVSSSAMTQFSTLENATPPAKYGGIWSRSSDKEIDSTFDSDSILSELGTNNDDIHSDTSLDSPLQPPHIKKKASPKSEPKSLNELCLEEKESINVWGLRKIASSLRNGCPCFCDRDDIHVGASNLVAYIEFDDGVMWVARLPLQSAFPFPFDHARFREYMESMVTTMEYIAQKTSLPVPTTQAWDVSCNNLICRPFILMQHIPGENFLYHFASLDDVTLRKVIMQWADYNMQLATLRFTKIGSLQRDAQGDITVNRLLAPHNILADEAHNYIRGPFHSTADYLLCGSAAKGLYDAPNRIGVRNGTRKPLATMVDSMLPFLVEQAFINGPFVLHHSDFGVHNLLINPETGAITGILGWEWAAVLPLQSHIYVPEELNYEFLPVEEIEQLPGGLAGNAWKVTFSQKYRDIYEEALVASAERLRLEYPVEDVLDRSLMYSMYEKASFSVDYERYFPALWHHVFGSEKSFQELTFGMKYANQPTTPRCLSHDDRKRKASQHEVLG